LALHAKSISFKHPAGGKQMTFEADVPTYFAKLMPDQAVHRPTSMPPKI
jgi:hypothetical protein